MKYYIDITLLPDADITPYIIWRQVYQQLHLAFVSIQNADGKVNIGVGFPQYNFKKHQLGNKLRLFAVSKNDLETLNMSKWLSRLRDYTHSTSVRPIPDKISGYAAFQRIQSKNSIECLARRRVKRKDINYAQALIYFDSRKYTDCRAPFVHIKSSSTGQAYRLFIRQVKMDAPKTQAVFSTYGLSSSYGLPLFT